MGIQFWWSARRWNNNNQAYTNNYHCIIFYFKTKTTALAAVAKSSAGEAVRPDLSWQALLIAQSPVGPRSPGFHPGSMSLFDKTVG